MKCVVCKSCLVNFFTIVDSKTYWECRNCYAKFLDRGHFLDQVEEERHYLKHQNNINDTGYREFLSRLWNPLINKLSIGDKGLDFGCGNGPALSSMIGASGFGMDLYDPFFYPDKKIFKKSYDFITCTEVAEHFFDPHKEFDLLDGLLKAGGWLALMTCFLTDKRLFNNWHYRRDPTHVVFYSEKTFKVIAEQRQWTCEIPAKDVVLLFKNPIIVG